MDPLALMHDPAIVDAFHHFAQSVENTSGSVVGKAGTHWLIGRIGQFFNRHVKDEDEANQLTSVERLLDFYQKLDQRLIVLESRGATSENFRAAFADPQASRIIDAACIVATETSDVANHEILADLIAQRIAAPNETLYAMYLRRSTESMRDLQPRHLAILGEIYLIQDGPSPPLGDVGIFGFQAYETWLSDALQRLDVAEVQVGDLDHLQSLSLVIPSPPRIILENEQRLVTHENSFVQNLLVRGFPEQLVRKSEAVRRAARLLDARNQNLDRDYGRTALGDYRLTGAGDILAVTVMRQRGVGEFMASFGVYSERGAVPTYRSVVEDTRAPISDSPALTVAVQEQRRRI
jgi:hypothetical protein